MNIRTFAIATALSLFVTAAGRLQAQNNGFFRQFPDRNVRRDVNPVHERAKSEAEQAYRRGDYDRAISLTSGVLRSNPQDDVALYLRASARVEQGEANGQAATIRQGISDARDAIRFKPSDNADYYLPYLRGMTALASVEGRPSHADVSVQVADQVLKRSSLSSQARANLLYQRANALVVQQKFDAAIEDFNEVLSLSSSHLGAYVGLADAYAAAGRSDEAETAFDKCVDRFPSNPLVYNNRGMFLQQQQDYQKAIADFTRALEIDPNYYVAQINRGFTLLEAGNAEAAESDFTAALTNQPGLPSVHRMRGTARLEQGKLQAAIDDYRQAVELTPDDPAAYADLAFAEFFAEEYQSAQSHFQEAVSRDAELRFLKPWRCAALIASNQEETARSQYSQNLNREADDRDWVDRLIVHVLGELAAPDLLAATDDGDDASAQTCEAHFFIGQRKLIEGDKTAAIEHFQKALDTQQDDLSAHRGAELALARLSASGSK